MTAIIARAMAVDTKRERRSSFLRNLSMMMCGSPPAFHKHQLPGKVSNAMSAAIRRLKAANIRIPNGFAR
jgi:hypothetical protein